MDQKDLKDSENATLDSRVDQDSNLINIFILNVYDKNGDAFISCGVSHTAIQNWLEVARLKLNENKQVSHDLLPEVATKAVA